MAFPWLGTFAIMMQPRWMGNKSTMGIEICMAITQLLPDQLKSNFKIHDVFR